MRIWPSVLHPLRPVLLPVRPLGGSNRSNQCRSAGSANRFEPPRTDHRKREVDSTLPAVEGERGFAAPSRSALGLELPIASPSGASVPETDAIETITSAWATCGKRARGKGAADPAENKQVTHG